MARVYELTDKGRGMEFKNQQKLVHGALLDGPRTAEQIAESIKSQLVTRQPPVKVAQFYLSVWKKEGVVKISNEATPAVTPANVEKTDEPQVVEQLTPPVIEEVAEIPVSEVNSTEPVEVSAIEMTSETTPPATSELPALQQGDEETLMAYMYRIVSERGPIWPTDIEEITSGAIRKKQASDTLRRLQGKGVVARTDQGFRKVNNVEFTE